MENQISIANSSLKPLTKETVNEFPNGSMQRPMMPTATKVTTMNIYWMNPLGEQSSSAWLMEVLFWGR